MKNCKDTQKITKSLFSVLPYSGVNIITSHKQFNNLLTDNHLPTKKYLDKLHSLYDLDIFSLNTRQNSLINPDIHSSHNHIHTSYYSPHSFNNLKKSVKNPLNNKSSFSILHNNIRSLRLHLEDFQAHLLHELDFSFDIMGISETKLTSSSLAYNLNLDIPGYSFEYVPTPLASGGVGMYINSNLNYSVIEKTSNSSFQALWIEIHFQEKKNIVCGIIYRQHNSPNSFLSYFDESLEKYSNGKSVYIMGDFNIDLLKSETCNFSHNFLLSLQSCHFLPTIDKPTRVYNNSATLIDNIFINNPEHQIISGNIVSDISDHFTQFCILSSSKEFITNTKKKRRDFSKFSKDVFLDELSNIDFSLKGNVDQMFSAFYKKLNKLVNKHAPLKKCSKRDVKNLSKPWITRGLQRSIKVKNKFLMAGDTTNYKLYRNKISYLTRINKKHYFHSFFNENITNIKNTWQGINMIITNKKKNQKQISAIRDPNTNAVTYDKKDISNVLNEHFTSVGHKLASQVPESTKHFTDYLSHINQNDSFFLSPTTDNEIEQEIMMIPNNKSYGLYSFPISMLKTAKHLINKPLADLFNKSVESGTYPSKLKSAKITPIFKSDDSFDPNNYRPISLLSIFNRIFEKLVHSRLTNFIEKHNLLNNAQYGFRKGFSTSHAILDLISTIQANMDKKRFSCAVFIDLKKAFDTVNHSILLKKLNYYGIRGLTNDWFESYLSGRTQTTEVGSNVSGKKHCLYGVPQGSVLGPLLFLLYINDIVKASTLFTFFLFADDTNLLYANKDLKMLERIVNSELVKLCNWLTANKLTLNIKKSNFVIFRPHQKKISTSIVIKIPDQALGKYISLENKEYVKFLGLLIDSKLSWKNHIDYISTKISKSIGLIAKLRYFVPQNTLITLYWSLVHPYLNYGISAWGQASKTLMNKLLLLQKRALRFIFFVNSRESAIPLFIKTAIPPLNTLFFQSIANLMHDVINEKAPQNLCKLFTSISETHSYNTRSSADKKLYTQASRINIQLNSFSRVGVRLWNSIPLLIRNKSKNLFKKEIKELLFSILENEKSYVEIEKAIQIFSTFSNK